ncbi:FAD-dependent oxidoreductase [Micromonospora antibiotica]|uniref:FAD-dependent monooxygenase n=1 Tax=Micromonospora antibiotica TaxID=2807623 RepID=A0ABS3V5Y1_9ACTN|nr:FAD-dependent monooxygenase [Micromonospora antibiotica]MBO4161013.1 FAD-dependent monooxygenase [Micromonospora antibiotica]
MATDSAVVVGASIGGLLAARVLSETHGRVTLVDRDPLPEQAASRRGVPQGRQLHVLLDRGRQVLEELLPGVTDELVALGAPLIDLHGDVRWYNDGYLMQPAASGLRAIGVGRPLLEQVIRNRVAALPGVTILPGHEVTALTTTPDRRRVTGVRVHRRADGPSTTRELSAELVVDAGGRGTRSPVWLAELGYRPAPEEQVPVGLTYVTRLYHRQPQQLDGLLGVLTNAVPGRTRGGIVAVQEQDRFAVALSGMFGEEPPLDDAGLLAYADSLPAPEIGALLRHARPLGAPARMRFPASVRRRYERLRRFPAGYLVFGDALCSFNPIYGQGITAAALQAVELARLLPAGPHGLARRFFRRAARVIDMPWSIAVGTDLRFPEVPGPRSARVRLTNAYVHRLHAAATANPTLGAAFLRVLNLVDPPRRLLAPTVAARVLRGSDGSARRFDRPTEVGTLE